MAEREGIVIEFRGDTQQFDKAVKQVNGELKETKSEISLLNKQLKLDPKNVEVLTKKFETLKQKEQQLTELTKTLQDGMKKLDPNSKEWSNYNKQLQSATYELQRLKSELSSMPSAKIQVLAQDFEKWGKTLDNIGSRLEAVGKKLTVLSGGIVALATGGVKFNAQMEQYTTAFTTLIGDGEKASKVLQQIQEDASKSPFSTESLVEANQYLISAGVEADESRQMIMALGDAIASTGGGSNELSRMAQNLQQIKNLGKASSVDIKQFANAGINIYGLLAETTGKSVEQLKEMDITYEQLLQAFSSASSEGGKYFGAMAKQSETLNGSISTLKDSISQLLGELTAELMPIIKNILSYINDLIKRIKAMSPEQKKMITNIGLLLASLSPVLIIVGKIIGTLGTLSTYISGILKSEKLIAFFKMITANGSSLGAVLKTLATKFGAVLGIVGAVVAVFVLLYAKCEPIREAINNLASALGGYFVSVFKLVVSVVQVAYALFQQVMVVLGKLWQSFANSEAGQQFLTFVKNVIDGITQLIKWFTSLIDWITKAFSWFGKLIGIASDFNSVSSKATSRIGAGGTLIASGGLMSGGYMASTINVNNTFTITNGNGITDDIVLGWADVMTNRINENLGRMV